MVETQDTSSKKREASTAISFAAAAAGIDPTKAGKQASNDAHKTANGSASVSNDDLPALQQQGPADEPAVAAQKKASLPPKVNPWKVKSPEQQSPAAPLDAAEVASPTKSGKTNGASADDQMLWPTLDKALQQVEISANGSHRRQSAPESGAADGEHTTTNKPAGRKEWVKYMPIITHTPIASQTKRTSTSVGSHARGNSTANGRATNGTAPRYSRSSSAGNKDSDLPDGTSHAEPGNQGRASRVSGDASRQRTSDRKRAQSASNQRQPRSPVQTGEASPDAQSSTWTAASSRSSSKLRGNDAQSPIENGHTNQHPLQPFTKPQRFQRDGAFSSSSSTRGRGNGYAGRGHRGNFGVDRGFSHANGHHNNGYRNGRTSFGSHRDFLGFNGDGGPLSFVNPAQQPTFIPGPAMIGMPPMMLDPMMARSLVQQQLEYYFSIENLCKDMFLRKHMDDEGYVALPILARFNRVRSITFDYTLIRDVCAQSSMIELKCVPNALDKIRKQEGWQQWVLPEDQRDASTQAQSQQVQAVETDASAHENGIPDEAVTAAAFVPGKPLKQVAPTPQVNEVGDDAQAPAASEAA